MDSKKIIKELTKKIVRRILKDTTILGGTFFYLLTTLFLYFTQKQTAIKLIVALITTYIIISFIRIIYFKDRPKKKKYNNIIEKIDASSFPSMHATRIIILALALINIYKNNIILTTIITITIIVGISRIYLKKHYIIDVIAGYILGLIIYLILF